MNRSVIVEPELNVDRDLNIVLDARQAKQVGFMVDRTDAKAGDVTVDFDRRMPWGSTGLVLFQQGFENLFVRPSSTTASIGTFTFSLFATMARPDGAGTFSESP